MKKVIRIEGMSCMHCVKHVKDALQEVNGVKAVEVNLQDKYALVEVEGAEDAAMKAAIEDAGYDVLSIIEE